MFILKFTVPKSCNFGITWLLHILVLSIPVGGYSRNASCALNLISTFLLSHTENVPTLIYLFLFVFGVKCHFQQYFSFFMATDICGGRSRSTRRVPPTMSKQLVSFITCHCEWNAPFFLIYKAGCEPTPYW